MGLDRDRLPESNGEEVFEGSDVASGKELVVRLLYEDVGIPVYKINPQEKRTEFLVDRKVGSEDVTLKQKDRYGKELWGIIIPALDKNEFVFLGIEEGGFVFSVSDERFREFHKDTTASFTLAMERFGGYITGNFLSGTDGPAKVILTEDSDSVKFQEVVLGSVQKERKRAAEIKEKRAELREGLIDKLFGTGNSG